MADQPRGFDEDFEESLYKYEALKFPFPIRLLKVIPTENGGFSYELIHTTLEHGPPFQSVSYAWGHNIRDHRLTLRDGTQLAITKNLFDAIPYVSRLASSGYLWIDQICIHQDNFSERNIQVKNMGSLYTLCESCLIWIVETESLDAKTNELFEIAGGDDTNAGVLQKIPSLDIEGDAAAFERVLNILSRPWFSRAWVIQEAILPSRGYVIFGKDLINVKALVRGLTYFVMIYANRITDLHCGIHSVYDAWTQRQLHDILIPFPEKLSMLNEESHASDSRDRVYAFLGLKDEESIDITPEYSAPVAEAYADAATAMVRGSSSLEIFRTLCRHGQHDLTSVPSWAPNWEKTGRKQWMLYETQHSMPLERKPRAAQGRQHIWKDASCLADEKHRVLFVKGKIIDTIKWEVDPAFEGYSLATQSVDLGAYLHLHEIHDRVNDILKPRNENCSRVRLLRAILANVAYECHPAVEAIQFPGLDLTNLDAMLESYDIFKSSPPPAFQDPTTLQEAYYKAVQSVCRVADDRKIFVTEKGKLCLASLAKEGDVVVILHGSTTPVILRLYAEARYLVIMDCYLEEAMFGEAVTWSEEEADELILI